MTEEEFRNPAATSSMIIPVKWSVSPEGFSRWGDRTYDFSKVYLVERKHDPFKGMWALPGGFLDYGKENLEEAAVRELREETGFVAKTSDLLLFQVNSNVDRDPRDHVIDHVYLVYQYEGEGRAGDDASQLSIFSVYDLPDLAFDHGSVLENYVGVYGKRSERGCRR